MLALLRTFSWQELRHHPWRNATAVAAVMLGVALAFSVHLINASALSEFSSAVRSVNGQSDLELRAAQGGFDETLYARVAAHPQVALASPVLELSTLALAADGQRKPLRVIGVDALAVAALAPALMPVPAEGSERLAVLAPGQVFLNPAARQAFGATTEVLRLQSGLQLREARIAGRVSAGGGPLAVMDIAAAQDLFGRGGQLTRIDLRLAPGADPSAVLRALQLPPGVAGAEPGDAAQRVSSLSHAYRVNLTVLALVALFTGAFLVFSVLALSVARRAQQFALLGVLGLAERERGRLVLTESLLLGCVGSAAGIALGSALAAAALRLLGGATWLDAKQLATGTAATDGQRVIGVPRLQGSMGVEWDVPAARGLALDSRVVHTGSSYANATGTLKVPGWTRLDVGARYLTEIQGRPVTLRARIDNLTDRNYWASVGGYPGSGYLVVGAPRTFSLSASVDF